MRFYANWHIFLVALMVWGSTSHAQEKEDRLRVDRCTQNSVPTKSGNGEAAPPDTKPEPAALGELEANTATKRARDSYDRGLVLYEEGDFQGAVDAFVASYCFRASHASFYNIGQSYERLLDFERSVRYFQRYADEAPPDEPDTKKAALRAQVLRNLPAQLRIATVPAGASVTIESPAGVVARGNANGAAIALRQGKYTMQVELPGHESVIRSLQTKPGQPYAFYFQLQPKTGRLEVKVSPASARIFLNDRIVGVGEYSQRLPLGEYKLTVEASGYVSRSEAAEVTSEKATRVGVELTKPAKGGRNTLLIAAPIAVGLMGGTAMSELFRQDQRLAIAGSLATTAIAFGGSYYGIPDSLTRGDAWFLVESALIGAAEGGLLASAISCSDRDGSCNERALAGAVLSGGIAGAGLAALSYRRFQISTGDAALLGSGAIWGIGTGALFQTIFGSDKRTQAPLLLVGLNIGTLTAAGLVAHNDVSLRRVAIIDLAGVGGVLGGVSLAEAINQDGDSLQNFAILGLVVGLTAGTFLTRYLDEDTKTVRTTKSSSLQSGAWSPALGSAETSSGKTVLSYGFRTRF